MATRYFASDVEQFRSGSTGHIHYKLAGQERLTVDCAACDNEMVRYGAVTNPDDVPLTYNERRELDDQRRQAERYMPAFAQALSDGLVRVARDGQ